jgi:hypothetical protein
MKLDPFFLASPRPLASRLQCRKGRRQRHASTNVVGAASRSPAQGRRLDDKIVSATPEGGFVMGNPNAKVKLVEFGSMTCPHCAEFDEKGGQAADRQLCEEGPGQLGIPQLRPRPFDITASLIARCGGTKSFFGLTRACYADQKDWIGKIQAADPANSMQALEACRRSQQFGDDRQARRLPAMGGDARRAAAKTEPCLANEAESTSWSR